MFIDEIETQNFLSLKEEGKLEITCPERLKELASKPSQVIQKTTMQTVNDELTHCNSISWLERYAIARSEALHTRATILKLSIILSKLVNTEVEYAHHAESISSRQLFFKLVFAAEPTKLIVISLSYFYVIVENSFRSKLFILLKILGKIHCQSPLLRLKSGARAWRDFNQPQTTVGSKQLLPEKSPLSTPGEVASRHGNALKDSLRIAHQNKTETARDRWSTALGQML